jgi:hypothetical protein
MACIAHSDRKPERRALATNAPPTLTGDDGQGQRHFGVRRRPTDGASPAGHRAMATVKPPTSMQTVPRLFDDAVHGQVQPLVGQHGPQPRRRQ